jgi:hypothetical protein
LPGNGDVQPGSPPVCKHLRYANTSIRPCVAGSGSLAMLAAMRRASYVVSSLAAERRPRLVLEIDVGERLPAGVADDEAVLAELHVRVIDILSLRASSVTID